MERQAINNQHSAEIERQNENLRPYSLAQVVQEMFKRLCWRHNRCAAACRHLITNNCPAALVPFSFVCAGNFQDAH